MSNTKVLANQALNPENILEKKVCHMAYDKNGHRIGLVDFEPVQIETIGFMPLGQKVQRILTGDMDFHANEDELEFDQEEGTWEDEEPDIDPTNDFLDPTDIHDIHKELIEQQREIQAKASHVTKVTENDSQLVTSGTVVNGATKKAPDKIPENNKSSD